MGYSSGWQTKAKLIFDLTQNVPNRTLIAKSLKGNSLWTVWYNSEGKSFIGLDLITHFPRDRHDKSIGPCWGYKALGESFEPFYYDCPLNFLKLVPCVSPDWRKKVKAFHAEKLQRRKTNKIPRELNQNG
jgi:hypothetical protein